MAELYALHLAVDFILDERLTRSVIFSYFFVLLERFALHDYQNILR